MNFIYHEKQQGSLCGLHCLNNLLQGDYFGVDDLGVIACRLDIQEQQQLDNKQQASVNVDDSGMFSIQVLTEALKQFNMGLLQFSSSSPIAVNARDNPIDQRAYICNFREHWFTIRKIGFQWFNLNSMMSDPELISDTYLALFLKQLQHEGYSIFIVEGCENLPHCEAEEILLKKPAVQTSRPSLLSESRRKASNEDGDIQAAIAASLKEIEQKDDDEELRRAIEFSLSESSPGPSTSIVNKIDSTSEDDDLEKALQMSLNSSLCDVQVPENLMQPDLDQIRQRRLKFFSDKKPEDK